MNRVTYSRAVQLTQKIEKLNKVLKIISLGHITNGKFTMSANSDTVGTYYNTSEVDVCEPEKILMTLFVDLLVPKYKLELEKKLAELEQEFLNL